MEEDSVWRRTVEEDRRGEWTVVKEDNGQWRRTVEEDSGEGHSCGL